MKKIDAYWELRNLDRSVLEIEFEDKDTIHVLNDLTQDFQNYPYIVAKIPKGKLELVHSLEDMGFRFMETQFELSRNLNRRRELSRYVQKMFPQCTWEKVDTEEKLQGFLAKIEEGIFVTDRVSLDPVFGTETAYKRYVNWMSNAYYSGTAHIYQVELNSKKIGFFYCSAVDTNTVQGILTAVYKEHIHNGLGLIVIEAGLKWAKESGYSKLVIKTSSNNLEALRAYTSAGFETKNAYYILRKHPRQDALT
ncbi:GNAT family N-acetyltransferase [Paenibacillus pinistramenti]|uniref:GNAT family N-acetyltransferase n=1 Tax=Paenibacillus pinistramenti TaxID=1768003 RepID=UPI00110905C4|nr:GNAT family N-acetyltransferase [Paenibacillus pinistramenti]